MFRPRVASWSTSCHCRPCPCPSPLLQLAGKAPELSRDSYGGQSAASHNPYCYQLKTCTLNRMMTYAFAMNRICTGGIGMGRFDLLCVCVFSLVSREVDCEEDRGAGACCSAQSWAVMQPQFESARAVATSSCLSGYQSCRCCATAVSLISFNQILGR